MTKYQTPDYKKSEHSSSAEELLFKAIEFRESLDSDYDLEIRQLDYNRAIKRGVAPQIAALIFGLTIL